MFGRSMIPILTRRGAFVLASGAVFVLVGSLRSAPPLVALGAVVISALLCSYLWFFPIAILLRRKKVELSWWVPPGEQAGGALTVDSPFSLHLAFRNHGIRTLRILRVRILGTRALDLPTELEATVVPGRQVEVIGEGRSHAAGYQVLHGAVLRFGDALGLMDIRAYFPNPLAIKVFPQQLAMASRGLRPQLVASQDQLGQNHVRRRGVSGELREIREHTSGDSFKYIAWKSTARRRKLMVRDLENELVLTHQIVLDIGSTMRPGKPGKSKLDYAIESSAALAQSALGDNNRVGLLTFDSRVHSEMRPNTGHRHYLEILDRLIETHSVVDEDATDLTNGDLIATVARYLAYQEAVDARLRQAPPLDDPMWMHLQAGPSGELYDVRMLTKSVESLLKAMGKMRAHKKSAPSWWWSNVQVKSNTDPRLARLRLFCRLRGIELPYRHDPGSGRQAAGLADAIEHVSAAGRADVIVIVSDLLGMADRREVTTRALARARRRGQRVIAIAPFGPDFIDAPETDAGRAVSAVLAQDEQTTFERARRLFVRSGVPVIQVGPNDTPALLGSRIARPRHGASRRVA